MKLYILIFSLFLYVQNPDKNSRVSSSIENDILLGEWERVYPGREPIARCPEYTKNFYFITKHGGGYGLYIVNLPIDYKRQAKYKNFQVDPNKSPWYSMIIQSKIGDQKYRAHITDRNGEYDGTIEILSWGKLLIKRFDFDKEHGNISEIYHLNRIK